MPLTRGYGETPLGHDELDALLPEVGDVLDKAITRAAAYDLEQGLQDQLFGDLQPGVRADAAGSGHRGTLDRQRFTTARSATFMPGSFSGEECREQSQ